MDFHERGNGKRAESDAVKNVTNGGVVEEWFMRVGEIRGVSGILTLGCTGTIHRRMDKNRMAQGARFKALGKNAESAEFFRYGDGEKCT